MPSRSEETFHVPRRKAGRNNDKTVRAVRWPQTANADGRQPPPSLPLSRDDVQGVVSRGNSLRQQQFRGTSMFTARRVNAKTTLPLLWIREGTGSERDSRRIDLDRGRTGSRRDFRAAAAPIRITLTVRARACDPWSLLISRLLIPSRWKCLVSRQFRQTVVRYEFLSCKPTNCKCRLKSEWK